VEEQVQNRLHFDWNHALTTFGNAREYCAFVQWNKTRWHTKWSDTTLHYTVFCNIWSLFRTSVHCWITPLIQVSPPHIFAAYFSKIILIAFSHPRQLLRIPDPFLDVIQLKLYLSHIKYPTLLFLFLFSFISFFSSFFFRFVLFYRPKWRLQIVTLTMKKSYVILYYLNPQRFKYRTYVGLQPYCFHCNAISAPPAWNNSVSFRSTN